MSALFIIATKEREKKGGGREGGKEGKRKNSNILQRNKWLKKLWPHVQFTRRQPVKTMPSKKI